MYNVISIIERMVDMDKDIFDNQIFDTIDPPRKSTFKLAGSTLPNSQDIADYELPFPVQSDTSIWEVNRNCRMVLEIEGTPVGNEMKAIQEKWFINFEDFIDHKDEIIHYDVQDAQSLAQFLITEESVFGEIPADLLKHIDYASYGRELEASDKYLFTQSGVFRYQ